VNETRQPNVFPFFSILLLILITLKLVGAITLSWWWIFGITMGAPLALLVALLTFIAVIGFFETR